MRFKRLVRGRALYQTPEKIWMAKGMTFYAIDYSGNRISPIYRVGGLLENLLAVPRVLRQFLRVGLHHLLPLSNGNILVTAKRIAYIISPEGRIVNSFSGYQGNKPSHQGICITPDGTVLFAEYLLNPRRDHVVRLYKSTDNGTSFKVVKEWEAGEIRHIHFVKWDCYEKCLWLGTGDYGKGDKECRLYRSVDQGDSWELIGQGSQDWRAIGVCFTQDFLIWGTDAGSTSAKNHLVKMSRLNNQMEILAELEGPCHGCASYNDGRFFISTGVEGGENEKDRSARLRQFKNGESSIVMHMEKDYLPFIVQFGVMRFPLGTENCRRVVFTALGLNKGGEAIYVEY